MPSELRSLVLLAYRFADTWRASEEPVAYSSALHRWSLGSASARLASVSMPEAL